MSIAIFGYSRIQGATPSYLPLLVLHGTPTRVALARMRSVEGSVKAHPQTGATAARGRTFSS